MQGPRNWGMAMASSTDKAQAKARIKSFRIDGAWRLAEVMAVLQFFLEATNSKVE